MRKDLRPIRYIAAAIPTIWCHQRIGFQYALNKCYVFYCSWRRVKDVHRRARFVRKFNVMRDIFAGSDAVKHAG